MDRCLSYVVLAITLGACSSAADAGGEALDGDGGRPSAAPTSASGPGATSGSNGGANAANGNGAPASSPTSDASDGARDAGLDANAHTQETDGGSDAACAQSLSYGKAGALAQLGPCGRLQYGTYANQGETQAENILPDFSFAGYEGGGVAIPDVPVVREVQPVSGDARATLQSAIDAVSAMPLLPSGFRGAVLVRKGSYRISDQLTIAASGVVLRGEGQGSSGTVITATKVLPASSGDPPNLPAIAITGSGSGFGEVASTRTPITTAFVPVGARSFAVASSAALAVGDVIAVHRTPNDAWISDLAMAQFGWTAAAYDTSHLRTITAVRGNTIEVDIPLVDAIEARYGGGAVYKAKLAGYVRHSGVEDLRLESVHASDTDELHTWTGVRLDRVESCWVRRVTARYFAYGVVGIYGHSRFNTVEDTAQLDPKSQITGGRRYSFYVDKGIGNLFQRIFSREGRHNFVTGSQVTGPNVWLDGVAVHNHADDGPHHRWATGLLFDNTRSQQLHVQNRGSMGTGHGWAGAQVLFWNGDANADAPQTAGDITVQSPPGAMNWGVGCVGTRSVGALSGQPKGWWESPGSVVTPRSLYLQQLSDRRGANAVLAVTHPKQRAGRIWDAIEAWAGEGGLSDFLR